MVEAFQFLVKELACFGSTATVVKFLNSGVEKRAIDLLL
jgi:hypothetical protein